MKDGTVKDGTAKEDRAKKDRAKEDRAKEDQVKEPGDARNMRPLRILVLANKFPYPPRDGGSLATLNMLLGLSATGLEVSCLAMNTSKHYFPPEEVPGDIREKITLKDVRVNTDIRPLALVCNFLFSGEPYIARRFHTSQYSNLLKTLLEKESYDLVQLEGPYLGYYIDLIRKHSSARIILRAHNAEHQIWSRKAGNEKGILQRIYLRSLSRRIKKYEARLIKSCDILVPISPLDENCFNEMGHKLPCLTIPAGLKMDRYPETDLPAGRSIFFIGSLDWLPNIEGLEWFINRVFPQLSHEAPGLIFHVAGRNAPKRVEKLFDNEHIIYHGEVEDALEFMRAYRIMVAPLLTGSGIRIKILEAMALGRPVVTTPVGIEGIPARPGEEVGLAADPEEFKNQVLALVNNEEKAIENARKARLMVHQNFDTFGLSDRLGRFLKAQL